MNKLSIRIKIADREYPMTVDPAEEERVRKAAKQVNERLRSYRDEFGIDDYQDLLAMVAFDILVERLRGKEEVVENEHSIENRLQSLNGLLNEVVKD